MNLGQSFFKFISSSAKNELEIPPAFVLQMQEALANRSVILRDRCKNLWPVEVDRNRDKWCFKEGWPQFYEDNSLEPGNFLVFEYKAGNLFDFKLFGHDASEKKGVGALKFKEEELEEYKCEEKDEELNIQNEEYYSVDEEEEEEEDDDDDYDDNVDDADEDDEDYVQEEEETGEYEQVNISRKAKAENKSKSPVGVGTLSAKHKYSEKNVTGKKGNEAPICKVKEEEEEEVEDGKQNKKSAESDDVDPNDEHESNTQMEDGFDEEERQVNVSKKIKHSLHIHYGRIIFSPLLMGYVYSVGIGTIPSKRNYKKNADCYGADIFKSGVAVRPKNPYFVSRSRTTRKNELYIPKDVIVDYHLNIPEELFLIDERGRKWQTTIKQWKDGRLWCTKGWRSLCNVNNINKDDTCICEFVQEEGCKDPYILVHVVDRAARPDHLLSNSYV